MNDFYRTLHPNITPSHEDKEVALVAAFPGKCHYYCKKPGHRASEWRKKKPEQKNGKPRLAASIATTRDMQTYVLGVASECICT